MNMAMIKKELQRAVCDDDPEDDQYNEHAEMEVGEEMSRESPEMEEAINS